MKLENTILEVVKQSERKASAINEAIIKLEDEHIYVWVGIYVDIRIRVYEEE